jgi:TolB-like protein/class 3 adenylate cyclase/Tfp pilus assembly protein PilF
MEQRRDQHDLTTTPAERRLTAVMAADVVGYTRLMERDEDGTLTRLKAHRRELFEPLVAQHRGRTVKLMGDGALCEFASVVDAVRCAVLSQRGLDERERTIPEADRIRLRIGINLGDVIHDDDGDLYGDGVNVASRLEQLAEPGGVVVSGTAFDHLQGKLSLPLDFMGEQHVRHLERPVRAYRVRLNGRPAQRPPHARRRWMIAAAAVVVLLCTAGGWWLWSRPTTFPDRPWIAVLPFVNLSDQASDELLADGITDDLITDLAQLSGLTVIARNTVFSYKDRTVVVPDVGRALGVSHLVEGSVKRVGDRLRINAQLVDAITGASLWADRFDRSPGDIFAVENEVIRQVIDVLSVRLSPSEQARLDRLPTSNLEAYDSFLRAERAARSGFRPELRNALALYTKATELDPGFAEAFAAHARTAAYVWAKDYDENVPAPVARQQAFAMASHALRLDPDAPLPYAVLAVLQVGDRQYDEAIASAQQAVGLGPGNADAHAALGLVLTFAGAHAKSVRAVDEAIRLDPTPATGDSINAGLAYSLDGRHERAIEVMERARAAGPRVELVHLVLAVAYSRGGRIDDARAAAGGRATGPEAQHRGIPYHLRALSGRS